MTRADKLYDILNIRNIDAVLVTDRKNVMYYSGFTGSNGYLVVTKTIKILVTDSRYTVQAKLQCPGFSVIEMKDFDITKVIFSEQKVGFENKTISYNEYVMFKEKLNNMVNLDFALTELRAVKDDEEIKNITCAAQIADMAFSHIIEFIKEGMTEYEVSFELEMYMRKQGASSLSFESIVASGANGAMPHARPGDRKLMSGDLVVMDFGCVYNGYSSDMTRTVAIGDIDNKKLDVYNSVLCVQKECLNMAVPGACCKDIHNYSFYKLDGLYKDCYGHGLGHGVGLEVHELPNLNPRSEYILTPGNVITIEPGVYIDGFCGVRIEDLVVITEKGNEILSKSTKELIKIA